MKNVILYLVVGTILVASCNETPKKLEEGKVVKMDHHAAESKNVMMKAMDESMLAMHNVKQTGNADYDFAAMMIPHHEGAILMAQHLIKQNKSSALIEFSEKVITAQKEEVQLLTEFIRGAAQTPSNDAEAFKKALNASMKPMMDGMKEGTINGNIDHDFVALMIPHHQSAVEMAKAYLPFGENLQIKRMAEEIINTQQAEIKWLEKQK